MQEAAKEQWAEYLMEAAGLGLFTISASLWSLYGLSVTKVGRK